MRALHVISSLSLTSGGPSLALPAMAKALHGEGVLVDAATTDDEGRGARRAPVPPGEAVTRDGFRVFYFAKQTEFYRVSLPLRAWLMRHVKDYDIVHIHGVFSFPTIAAARAARKHAVPYIVRPFGVLNAYGMRRRRRLKTFSFRLVEKPLLDRAAAMHYTSNQERDEAACLRIKAPAHVIPLGMDLTPFRQLPEAEVFYQRFPEARGKQNVLFLSRLDPKKGLDLLLPAFATIGAGEANAHLVIAGGGPETYLNELKGIAERLGIARRITWTGQVEGELKLGALAAATVFVLPSYSENFGIALLEAMAAGLPCVSTREVALAAETAPAGAVRLAGTVPAEIADAVLALLNDKAARELLGARAAAVAVQNYSLSSLGGVLAAFYKSLV